MAHQIGVEQFTQELFALLVETFEQVDGYYLDRGTSLFDTLAGISAEEASRPVSATCASIAAQVEHVRVYIELIERELQGEAVPKLDWQATWQREGVTVDEWDSLRLRLRDAYDRVSALLRGFSSWDGENDIGGALSILVHTAYHLGEIRQALCTVRR